MPTAFLLALCLSARADVPPPPHRPDWDDPPAPLPAPPEALAALAAALVACAAVWALRSNRRSAPGAP